MLVLKYVTKEYIKMNIYFDQIWLIMPCSPLILTNDLIKAENMYATQKKIFKLMSVSRYPAPIEWAYQKNQNGILKATTSGAFKIPSQQLKPSYYDTGNFYVFSENDVLISEGAGEGENFLPYEIPFVRGIDIDDEDDWEIAEKLFSFSLNHK